MNVYKDTGIAKDSTEDRERRHHGVFYTPDIWVAEAYKSLAEVLGPTWKQDCVVWDPACGQANLTRGYEFSDLILSTLEESDITEIDSKGYNPGSHAFRLDYLSREEPNIFFDADEGTVIPPAVDATLTQAAEAGKRLVFLMNPPYGTSGDAGAKGTSKAGIAVTIVGDAHVYAILHHSNNCTAMREVAYKDGPPGGAKKWTIHNHFFWRTHASAMEALDEPETPTLYADCRNHPSKDVFGNPVQSTPDPYMASVLPHLNLSPEAQEVLDRLDALWLKSLPDREAYAAGKPELHLLAWDAGVYQGKHLWRDLYPTEWAALQASFKRLAAKLQPGVYEYGFLLK